MKIRAVCIVKNEVDVVGHRIRAALNWCDAIYVSDNGSDDGTWEVISEIADSEEKVISLGQDLRPFRNTRRFEIAERFADQCESTDWWAILDADEFFVDDPRTFLEQVSPQYHLVVSASFQYYYTDSDVLSFVKDPAQGQRIDYATGSQRYYVNNWGEPRFVRQGFFTPYVWTPPQEHICPSRIRVRHLQYRFPKQIQARLDARAKNPLFSHEQDELWEPQLKRLFSEARSITEHTPSDGPHWTDRAVLSSQLVRDSGDELFVINHTTDVFPKETNALQLLPKDCPGSTLVGVHAGASFLLARDGDAVVQNQETGNTAALSLQWVEFVCSLASQGDLTLEKTRALYDAEMARGQVGHTPSSLTELFELRLLSPIRYTLPGAKARRSRVSIGVGEIDPARAQEVARMRVVRPDNLQFHVTVDGATIYWSKTLRQYVELPQDALRALTTFSTQDPRLVQDSASKFIDDEAKSSLTSEAFMSLASDFLTHQLLISAEKPLSRAQEKAQHDEQKKQAFIAWEFGKKDKPES